MIYLIAYLIISSIAHVAYVHFSKQPNRTDDFEVKIKP
jgi:hypothetical protein